MNKIDLSNLTSETFAIKFGINSSEISAESLGQTLSSLTILMKLINDELNPGHKLELVVDETQSGSFWISFKEKKVSLKSLLSGISTTIVIPILVMMFYDKYISDDNITIIVNTDEYIVQADGKTIILPRDKLDRSRRVAENPKTKNAVYDAFDAMENNNEIESIGIYTEINGREPMLEIPRRQFSAIKEVARPEEATERIVEETVDLQIFKAVMFRSKNTWTFVWDGKKISAQVADQKFYDKLTNHEFMIGTGDSILCLLEITQIRDQYSGIWMNTKYKVTNVINYIPSDR